MKFLDPRFEHIKIMPLNYIYHRSDDFAKPDSIDIIFKEIESGIQHLAHIDNPEIEVYIVKPEYRNYNHIRDYVLKDNTDAIKVPYRTRKSKIAKIMKISKDETLINPYILGIDIDICNFYAIHFLIEYGNDDLKPLGIGYLDIENDIISIREGIFPAPGTTPINAITYIDGISNTSYTLLLRNSENPQIMELESGIPNFVAELHDLFDASYGNIDYNILFFDDEISLLIVLFKILRQSHNDYIEVWNLDYDLSNIVSRIIALGVDPTTVISDPEFPVREVKFEGDKNPVYHKRKHICELSTLFTFTDDMVNYCGIRSAKGKIPSAKLNIIGKKELNDEKINYSEEGNIRTFPWRNYRKFVVYNIKDVLLQKGIEFKTKDLPSVYSRCYMFGLTLNQAFTSTSLLTYGLTKRFYEYGYVFGNNKNKINYDMFGYNPNTLDTVFESFNSDDEPELIDSSIIEDSSEDEEETEEVESITTKKKKKGFVGALVANPLRMSPTGVQIRGQDAQFVHDDVIDQDITSEYPSAARIMNLSNETLIGKFEIDEPEKIDIPMYNYKLLSKEEEENYSKLNKSALFMELIAEDAILEACEMFLNLPTVEEVIAELQLT